MSAQWNKPKKPRISLRACTGIALWLLILPADFRADSAADEASPPPVRVSVRQFQMGMLVRLTVYAPDRPSGEAACKKAFQRIREINLALSDYEPRSELSVFCRRAGEGPVVVSEHLFRVLACSRRLAELTNGRFDPTAAPVIRLWRQARQEGRAPDPALLEKARALVGWDDVRLDPVARTAALLRPGMQLDLGAIGKGYAGDQALAVLREEGVPSAVYEAGGDLVFGDPPPGATGWLVETPDIEWPPRRLTGVARGVSGDVRQHLEVDGIRYSHVVDPASGKGVTSRRFCIVEAPLGLHADPLATIGTLLPPDAFRTLLRTTFPDARAWVFDPDWTEPRIFP